MKDMLPPDVQRLIFDRVDETADAVRLAAVSTSWRDAYATVSKESCVYDPHIGTTLRAIDSHVRFLEKLPPGTVEVLQFYVDLPSCPDFGYGLLRSVLARLCDVLDAQKTSLRRIALSFVEDAVRPCFLRRMIRVVQPSFFRLQEAVGRLGRLRALFLRGCLMPLRTRSAPSMLGYWLLVEPYAVPSSVSPSVLITRFHHSATRFSTDFHVLIKPAGPHHVTAGLADYVASRRVERCIEGSLEVSESDATVNVWGSDDFGAPPCFIFFVLALRAVNYEIFRRGLVDRVNWKPAFSAPELSIRIGFMAERLPA